MKMIPVRLVSALFVFFLSIGSLVPLLPAAEAKADEEFAVLVFSKTAGFRHDSIEKGVEAIKQLGQEHGFQVEATEDSTQFTPENLSRFAAVVFNNTTQTVFNAEQRAAFKQYIQNGGGFVGIHAASDTEYDWEWYGRLVGAYFAGHPRVQEAVVRIEMPGHPATKHLSESWTRRDEWYNFRQNPRNNVRVLLSLDTDSFRGSTMKEDHPISWYHEFDGGRSFYTGFGHTKETFAEEDFLKFLLGGILWTVGKAEVMECCK